MTGKAHETLDTRQHKQPVALHTNRWYLTEPTLPGSRPRLPDMRACQDPIAAARWYSMGLCTRLLLYMRLLLYQLHQTSSALQTQWL